MGAELLQNESGLQQRQARHESVAEVVEETTSVHQNNGEFLLNIEPSTSVVMTIVSALFHARMPDDVRAELEAAAGALKQPAWRVVN